MERIQIKNGISLTNINTNKFSSSIFSMTFLMPLSNVNASALSILPYILLRGSKNYDNLEKINKKLNSLYGAKIEPIIRKKGEHLAISLATTSINTEFTDTDDLISKVYSLLCEIVFNPLVLNNAFNKEIVESEKINLINRIESIKNDKRVYANARMFEIMCASEAYSKSRFGTVEEANELTPENLFISYNEMLANSQIEIFYCGKEDISSLDFSHIAEREISKVDIKTKFNRPNVKEVLESLDITQGKLSIGFRTNVISTDENYPALAMFNTMLGASTSSKLFTNVREKMSLCYYASSGIDKIKGVMSINSGIEINNFSVAKEAILKEFSDMCEGNFENSEIESAKLTIINNLDTSKDSPFSLEDYYLTNALIGSSTDIDELKESILKVSKNDILEVSKQIYLDTIFFLTGDKFEK